MTKSPKLTDLQLVLLSGAAARSDQMILPPSESVRARGKTLERVLAKLLDLGLVEEVAVTSDAATWREAEGKRIGLRLAAAGRTAIVIDDDSAEQGMSAEEPLSASPDRLALKPGTKQAKLAELLTDPEGATLDTLSEALGWQAHTIRAAVTGLRKRGFIVSREPNPEGGSSVYRLTQPDHADAA